MASVVTSGRIFLTRSRLSILRSSITGLWCSKARGYLSAAYHANEAWDKRRGEELVNVIKPHEYYVELIQRVGDAEKKLWAIDVDLYIQSLSSDGSNWNSEDLEELLNKIRRSPQTMYSLPSTQHTVVRLLLHNNYKHSMFRMLSQPLEYGLFVDGFTANLLMDHYLEEKDYTACARVASLLMNVEDFGASLTQRLALLSCLRYAAAGATSSAGGDGGNIAAALSYAPTVEEPEEDFIVREEYRPNAYFDDHFDLVGTAAVGRTLTLLARWHLRGDAQLNIALLGAAMHGKWRTLTELLHEHRSSKEGNIDPWVLAEVRRRCGSHEEAKDAAAAAAAATAGAAYSVLTAAEEAVTQAAAKGLDEAVAKQEGVYEAWAAERVAAVAAQVDGSEQRSLVKQIEEKKLDLKRREQLIFYFDNEKKVELLLSKKGNFDHPFRKPRPKQYMRSRKKKIDEDYTPPQVAKRRPM